MFEGSLLSSVWAHVGSSSSKARDEMAARRRQLMADAPPPTFWLLGKTQSGKSSVVRNLTGRDDVAVGKGFRPCTRASAVYDFPNEESVLMRFVDTRGLGEVGYDPAEDLAKFGDQTHAVIVTVRATDHAQESLRAALAAIRAQRPDRPVVLAVTCLHQAYPGREHPPYTFGQPLGTQEGCPPGYETLGQHLAEHCRMFAKPEAALVDAVVPLDFTPPAEGFTPTDYGAEALRQALVSRLPAAQGQAVRQMASLEGLVGLASLHESTALPDILFTARLAAAAAAMPVPVVDVAMVTSLQFQMARRLADLYGREPDWALLGAALGVGMASRAAWRSLVKIIPVLGPILAGPASAVMAYTSTVALGRTVCWYLGEYQGANNPTREELATVFADRLAQAHQLWNSTARTPPPTGTATPSTPAWATPTSARPDGAPRP